MRTVFPALIGVGLQTGCVVAVEDSFCESADVRAIVLDISNGDVQVQRSGGRKICGEIDLGGVGSGGTGRRIEGDILFLDYQCDGFCGGDLSLTAPSDTLLDVRMGAGDLSVRDWDGDIVAGLGAGEITLENLTSQVVHLVTGAGAITADWRARPREIEVVVATGAVDLEVPAGEYSIDLSTKTGSIASEGVVNNVNADASILVETNTGAITLRGR